MDIEKNIPIPAVPRETVFGFLYTMQVGDSVLLDTKDLNTPSLMASRAYAKKRYGKRFSLPTLPEGTRIWRVE